MMAKHNGQTFGEYHILTSASSHFCGQLHREKQNQTYYNWRTELKKKVSPQMPFCGTLGLNILRRGIEEEAASNWSKRDFMLIFFNFLQQLMTMLYHSRVCWADLPMSVNIDQLRKVWRGNTMECLVGKQENFEVDSLINREPVKNVTHNRGYD